MKDCLNYIHDYQHIVFKLDSQYNRLASIQDGLDKPIGDKKRHVAEDKLLYRLCEMNHIYCGLMHQLDTHQGINSIDAEVKDSLQCGVKVMTETGDNIARIMQKAQTAYGEEGWHKDFFEFSQMMYRGDMSVNLVKIQDDTYAKIQDVINIINSLEKQDGLCVFESIDQFAYCCQTLGEGKAMLENCLIPYSLYSNNVVMNQVLNTMYEKLEKCAKENRLDSQITPRGFMLSQTRGFDKTGNKNYFVEHFKDYRILTNHHDGAKLVQRADKLGTKAVAIIKMPNGDEMHVGYQNEKGQHVQFNPGANKVMQATQYVVSGVGSFASNFTTMEKFIRQNYLGGITDLLNRCKVSYHKVDINETQKVSQGLGTISTIGAEAPKQSTGEAQSSSGGSSQQKEELFSKAEKDSAKILIDCLKQMVKNVGPEVNGKSPEEYIEALEKIDKACDLIAKISKDGLIEENILSELENLNINETVKGLSDFLYEYQNMASFDCATKVANQTLEKTEKLIDTIVVTHMMERAQDKATREHYEKYMSDLLQPSDLQQIDNIDIGQERG